MNVYNIDDVFYIFIFLVLSYFLGSIPFGMIVGKIAKIGDIRFMGSGNIGATNVYRIGGKKLGIITFLLDFSKCLVVPIVIQIYFLDAACEFNKVVLLWCSFCSTIGHVFSIWLKFKGGKAVASLFALSFVLKFWIGVILALLWCIVFKAFRYSSVASLLVASVQLLLCILIFDHITVLPVFLVTFIVFLKHKDNIKRLISGTENRL